MAVAKKKRTLKSMTKAQKEKYYKEYYKSRKAGIDKWTAIKFARSMALLVK